MKKHLKNLIMMSIAAGSLSMGSCRNSEEKQEKPAPPMQNEMHQEGEIKDMENEEIGTESTAEFKEEGTATTYAHYLVVKDALVKTDAMATQTGAKDLLVQLEEVNSSPEIIAAARAIAISDNVNEQREAFSDLTKALEPILNGSLDSGTIYKQYCPMAFEGKGDYWYSNSKEIRNPYFGDIMLTCGRVEETIN